MATCYRCMRGELVRGYCNFCGRPVRESRYHRPEHMLCHGTKLLAGEITVGECVDICGYNVDYFARSLRYGVITLRTFRAYIDPENYTDGKFISSPQIKIDEQNFLKEAEILKDLGHPNLPKVLFGFLEDSIPYYALRALKDYTMKDFIKARKNKPMKAEEAVCLIESMFPLMDAVSCLHNIRLIHREIEPSSILLRNWKVGDKSTALDTCLDGLGAATYYKDRKEEHSRLLYRRRVNCYSRETLVDGTICDVYSISAVLYHALTGVSPQLFIDRLTDRDEIKKPSEINAELEPLDDILMRGMAIKPEEAIHTIYKLKAGLKAAVKNMKTRPESKLWPWKRRQKKSDSCEIELDEKNRVENVPSKEEIQDNGVSSDDKLILRSGTKLVNGEIVVGELLGKNGCTATYMANSVNDGAIVLKECLPTCLVSDARENNSLVVLEEKQSSFQLRIEVFEKEAHLLGCLKHPNIVKVLFRFKENNTAYYAMELLQGADLLTFIRARKGMVLSAREAADLIESLYPVLDALAYLHRREIVHMAIRPSNIFLRSWNLDKNSISFSPCLLGFGRVLQNMFKKACSKIDCINIRKPSCYEAFEWALFWDMHLYRYTMNIYSFCATLYHVLTGVPPQPAVDRMTDGDELKKPSEINPDLKPLDDVLMHGLKILPKDRTQTVTQLIQGLEEAVEALRFNSKPSCGRWVKREK